MSDTVPVVGDQEKCAICLENMDGPTDLVVWLKPCYHKYHHRLRVQNFLK